MDGILAMWNFPQGAARPHSDNAGGRNRQLLPFQNSLPTDCHSAILFQKPVSFPLRLERVNRWEHDRRNHYYQEAPRTNRLPNIKMNPTGSF